MCCNELLLVNHIKKYHNGGVKILGYSVPYTKTWTLEGYDDSNNLIIKVDKNERHNYLKYAEFIKQLKLKGYKLKPEQMKEIKDELLDRKFLPYARFDDLIEIAGRVHLTKCDNIYQTIDIDSNYIYSIKNFDYNTKCCIAEQLGLTIEELNEILENI